MKTSRNHNISNRSEPSQEVDDWACKVIGAAIEVHRASGPGYLESVYEEALAYEIDLKDIPYERQVKVKVTYKGHSVGEGKLDFLVAKLLPVGLLINFNVPLLKQGIKRVVYSG